MVAVELHNCPEMPVVFLGVTGIGATVTTINLRGGAWGKVIKVIIAPTGSRFFPPDV